MRKVGWCAEVKDFESAVCGTGCDYFWVMRVEECLIDACGVGGDSLNGMRSIRCPLEVFLGQGQKKKNKSGGDMESTDKSDGSIPR